MSKSSKPTSSQKLEELFDRVRAMQRGGDLVSLLESNIAELKALIYEEAAQARERVVADDESAFPP